MHSASFVPKDLVSRNGIYYLVDDVIKHEELGMNEVLTQYKMRVIVSTNYAADPLWAKLQTYNPQTHEPIPRYNNTIDHSSTTSSVESYSPQPSQSLPIINNNNIPTKPVETVPTTIPTPTTSTSQQQQQPIPQPTTIPTTTTTPVSFSIPSIANAHLSPPTPVSSSNSSTNNNTPHIAKSFRSPPPSDYFVNNAANLSYLSISQYFKLPLHEACVALRVDESSLKKRCRELGIRRWPYRKRCNITPGKGNTQTQQVEEQSGSGDQLFSCFQLNKGKGSPVVQKMKSEEALALEALDKLHNVNRSANNTTAATTVPSTTTTPATTSSTSIPTTTTTTVQQQQPTTTQQHAIVSHQPPRPIPQTAGTAYTYPPYPPHPGYPHMYPPHPGYHYPYGVPPPPTHDGSQPVVPYPMYYPPQTSVPPPGAYPPTEAKDGQPPYVSPYYYDYRYPYPQSGTPYPYPPPQPGYSYPPHPEQATYPYPPHGYPIAYPPHQMGYPQPVPQQVPKPQTTPVIVSTSPAESQPVTGTPCRTVSSSTNEPTTPVGSPQTKMVYQRETKVLHPVRYKPPSPTETTAEIAAKIKRERFEEQEEAAKKVRRDIQIANPTCSKPVSSQTVQNGSISASIKVAEK